MSTPSTEVPSLPGHERLTMADQMRAAGKSASLKTSPVTGAVESPRREFLKNAIQYRANQAARGESNDAIKDPAW